jgi:hypothetical protein
MRLMKKVALGLALASSLGLATAANAQKTVSGSSNGLSWEAQSRIVGVTSTGTIASGGDPLYLAPRPAYNGVVQLRMDYGPGGAFVCTGTLLPDRRSILTAAHCVGTANPLATQVIFSNNPNGDLVPLVTNPADPFYDPTRVSIDVTQYFVNSGYTGEVIDQNDIAILRLAAPAPIWATAHDILTNGDLTGEDVNIAGYGRRSSIGGAAGSNLGTGRLRQGLNTFDYAWGDSEFGGFFTDRDAAGENFFGFADIEFSYVSDFDSGLAVNDKSCRIAAAVGASVGFGCDLGTGAREVGVAGGDSGGPGFINGKIASVNSYGLTFGTGFGDALAGLNNSFGEYSGYVPTFIHENFVRSSMIPEPATWAMMIFGFGMVGGSMRRRATVKTVAA